MATCYDNYIDNCNNKLKIVYGDTKGKILIEVVIHRKTEDYVSCQITNSIF